MIPPVTTGSGIFIQRGLDAERTQLMKKVGDLENKLEKTQGLQENLNDRLNKMLGRLDEAEGSKAVRAELHDAKGSMDNLRFELEQLENQSIIRERDYREARERLLAEKEMLHGQLQILQRQLVDAASSGTGDSGELRRQLAARQALKQQLVGTRDRLVALEREMESMRVENISLKKQLGEGAALRDRVKELADKNKRLSEKIARTNAMEAEMAKLRTELDAGRSQLSRLTEANQSLTAQVQEAAALKKQLESERKKYFTAMAQVSELDQQLGTMQQNISQQLSGFSQVEKQMLDLRNHKVESVGRIEALAQDNLTMKGELAQLGKIKAQLESATRAAGRLKTIEAELATARAASVSAKKNMEAMRTENERIMQELSSGGSAKVQELSKSLTASQERSQSLSQQVETLMAQRNQVQESLGKQVEELSLRNAEMETQIKQVGVKSLELKNVQREMAKVRGDLDRASKNIANFKEEMGAVSKERDTLNEQIQMLTREKVALDLQMSETVVGSVEMQKLQQQLAKVQEDLGAASKNLQGYKEEVVVVSKERDSLKQALTQNETALKDAETKYQRQKELVKNIRDTMKGVGVISTTGSRTGAANMAKLEALTESLSNQQATIVQLGKEKSDLEQDILRSEGEMARMNKQFEAMKVEMANAAGGGEAGKLVESLNTALEVEKEKFTEQSQVLVSLQEQIKSDRATQFQLHENLKKAQSKMDQDQKQLTDYQAKVSDLQKVIEAKAPSTGASDSEEAKKLKGMLAQEKQRQKELSGMMAAQKAEIDRLKKDLARAASVGAGVKPPNNGSGADVPPITPPKTNDTANVTSAASRNYNKAVAQGQRHLKNGHPDKAIEEFLRAIEMDSNRVSARLGAAGAYYTRTDLPNADTMIQSVLVRDPENAQALGLQGIILFAKKDYVKAHEVVNKAIELSPKPDAQLYNYQGIIAHKRKRIGEAIKALEKAVELQPNHSEARFNLAVLYATKKPKDLEKAITHYELALKLGSRRDQALEKILYP